MYQFEFYQYLYLSMQHFSTIYIIIADITSEHNTELETIWLPLRKIRIEVTNNVCINY